MDKKEMFLTYVKTNVAPILEDFIFGKDLKDAVVLPADLKREELTGHYEGEEYLPPVWYTKLPKDNTPKLLVIDNIDKISKEEQIKFGEILKYRKVSTFELPKNCVIVVTAKDISDKTINEEIFSLVARI